MNRHEYNNNSHVQANFIVKVYFKWNLFCSDDDQHIVGIIFISEDATKIHKFYNIIWGRNIYFIKCFITEWDPTICMW